MENFDSFAREYKEILDKTLELSGETGDYFSEYKAKYLARCLGRDFSGKILDYGCGIGLLSEFLIKHLPCASVHGYDISSVSIERVPTHLKQRGLFKTDINDLRRDYDLIVTANVMHHVEPAERHAVIAGLKALMAPSGEIIIFEHNPFNPLTRKVVQNSPLDKGVKLAPPVEIVSYLKKAEFDRTQLGYIVFFPRFLSGLRWAEPFLWWLPLGAQYVVHGTSLKRK